jgi:hypothetical protein
MINPGVTSRRINQSLPDSGVHPRGENLLKSLILKASARNSPAVRPERKGGNFIRSFCGYGSARERDAFVFSNCGYRSRHFELQRVGLSVGSISMTAGFQRCSPGLAVDDSDHLLPPSATGSEPLVSLGRLSVDVDGRSVNICSGDPTIDPPAHAG